MNNPSSAKASITERLLSLDFFRGFTMLLLVGEFTHFLTGLTYLFPKGHSLHFLAQQFHHVGWEGLHFWDLVQPFFMFIVGVAMPFSFSRRRVAGASQNMLLRHVLKRSFLLLLLGWGLYCIGPGKIVFHFQDVLTQLSVTYLIAFLIMEKKVSVQLVFSFGVLLFVEVLYRSFPIEGFNHPFVPNENFGTWLDLQYGGADMHGHWVSFNAIPTAAHTIWGVLAGKLLLSKKPAKEKLKILILAGLAGVIIGYSMQSVTPIIKRIATSSFVIVSGGWAILIMAFSYWLIDIKKSRKWVIFFAVVGMNPLFIYLFAHVGGSGFIRNIILPFSNVLFSWTGKPASVIIMNGLVWFLLWFICYWMYKRKIFIRI